MSPLTLEEGPLCFIEARNVTRAVTDDEPYLDALVRIVQMTFRYPPPSSREEDWPLMPFTADFLKCLKPEHRRRVVAFREKYDHDDPFVIHHVTFYAWGEGKAPQ